MKADDPFLRRRAIETRVQPDNRFHPHTPLGSGPEFDAIRRMLERWGPRARRIGDDAGVITTLGDRALVASADTSIENVHFRAEWLTPSEIGYRATVAALSDLAAMGATPLGILCVLAVPESWRQRLDAITDAIGDAAGASNAPIIGGDMSVATELAITLTVLGTARDVLFRTSARPGDSVFVTGRLGGPGRALRDFQEGREPSPADRARFARPTPRIREAIWLSEHGATAAIDISDGLAADAGHLASASRVAVSIDLDKVPLVEAADALSAASSGEEYELLVASRAALDSAGFEQRFGVELTRIGVISEGPAQVRTLIGGEEVSMPAGYSHF